MLRYSKINLKRDSESINITYMQMISSVIKVMGIKRFYREFLADSIIVIEEKSLNN